MGVGYIGGMGDMDWGREYRGGGWYGILFGLRLGTMKEVWFTNAAVLCSLPTIISIAPSDGW